MARRRRKSELIRVGECSDTVKEDAPDPAPGDGRGEGGADPSAEGGVDMQQPSEAQPAGEPVEPGEMAPDAVPAGEPLPEQCDEVREEEDPMKTADAGQEKQDAACAEPREPEKGEKSITIIIVIIAVIIVAQLAWLGKSWFSGEGGSAKKVNPPATRAGAKSAPDTSTNASQQSGTLEEALPPPDVYVGAFVALQREGKHPLDAKQIVKVKQALKALERFDTVKAYLDESIACIVTDGQREFIAKKKASFKDAGPIMAEDKMVEELLGKMKAKAGEMKAGSANLPEGFAPGALAKAPLPILDFFMTFDALEAQKELAFTPKQAADFSAVSAAFLRNVPKVQEVSRKFAAILTVKQKDECRSRHFPALEKSRPPHDSLMEQVKKEFGK